MGKRKAPKGAKVIVYTDEVLSARDRREFKKRHPGYRLSFGLRYPNFPLVISAIAASASVVSLVLKIILG